MKIMKKLNNRGFLLVETVIVSVFVLTIFVMIYQNSLPLMSEYQQRIRYDDMNTVYAAGLIRKFFLSHSDYASLIEDVDEHGYRLISCSDVKEEMQSTCKALFHELGIYNGTDATFQFNNGKAYNTSRIFITDWDISDDFLKQNNLPKGIVDYVRYLQKQDQDIVTDYRILLSRGVPYNEEKIGDEGVETFQNIELYYANLAFADSTRDHDS